MKPSASPPPPLFLAGAVLLVGAGCATTPSPDPSASSIPASPSSEKYGKLQYAWHAPFFYDEWYDPAAIVLPPPIPGTTTGARKAPAAAPDAAALKEVDFR